MLPKVESNCRIVYFLHNEFGKRSDSDESILEEILSIMKSRKDQDNSLDIEIERSRWAWRRVSFANIKLDDLLDFSERTDKYLKILVLINVPKQYHI